jgi:hypothetical protein
VESDDRRFVFLRVSNTRQKDTVYFRGIAAAIANPKTIEALVYYLLKKDLTQFNVRAKPQTNEQLSQKIKSLMGFERFWFEMLNSPEDEFGTTNKKWEQSIFVSTSTLLSKYKGYHSNAEKYQPLQTSQVIEAVKKVCPSAITGVRELVEIYPGGRKEQQRGIRLPRLDVARRDFSTYLGHDIGWADEEEPAEIADDVSVTEDTE